MGAPFSQAQILHLMKAEFGRARRLGHALACIVLRIDGPTVLGDPAAVELRARVRDGLARLVEERTRDYDHLGLIGEDGYLLVLPHTDLDGAMVVAERIRRDFAGLGNRGADERPVTASFGVAATAASDTLFFDTLLAQSEHARDRAAAAGGDRIEAFRREQFVADPGS